MKKLLFILIALFFLSSCVGIQKQPDELDQLMKDMREATESAGKWSSYGDMGDGNVADVDTLMIKDFDDTSLGPGGTQKQYQWADVKLDLSSFSELKLPNANDTTSVIDVQAKIAHDNNHPGIAIHDDTNVRYYATRTKCLEPVVIEEPDQVQGISDTQPLYSFPAEQYPVGVVIEAIHIWSSATCTDTLDFREYSNNGTAWTNQNQIESITLSGVFTEDDGTLADNTVAADREIWIDMDDATDNIAWLKIQVCIQIPVTD
jgi:hypothetical protein